MEEERSKAIPLRKSRATRAARTAPALSLPSGSVGDIGQWLITTGPRQLWLGTLGGTSLAVQAAFEFWQRAVSEGEAVERWWRGPRRPPTASPL